MIKQSMSVTFSRKNPAINQSFTSDLQQQKRLLMLDPLLNIVSKYHSSGLGQLPSRLEPRPWVDWLIRKRVKPGTNSKPCRFFTYKNARDIQIPLTDL